MAKKSKSPLVTTPKPFVFVLMPFSPDFDDIYKFGIRGAAEDAGAYAERVDEQIFTEGILERIFNQIAKADVVVADMSTRNANVFYEVGYAHALGKTVLLITQEADDIPFDLKHKQHIVYGGKISDLRPQLAKSLRWAIKESTQSEPEAALAAFMDRHRLPGASSAKVIPVKDVQLSDKNQGFTLTIEIHNTSSVLFPAAAHLYLLAEEESVVALRAPIQARVPIGRITPIAMLQKKDESFPLAYKLNGSLPSIPPGAAEVLFIPLWASREAAQKISRFQLRIYTGSRIYEFCFAIRMLIEPPPAQAKSPSPELTRFAHLAAEPDDDE